MKRVVIIGAGPAGLICALKIKQMKSDIEVIVFEKGAKTGSHNLSGAVLCPGIVDELLDELVPDWRKKEIVKTKITHDDLLFFPNNKNSLKMNLFMGVPRFFNQGPASNIGGSVISVSRLCRYLASEARNVGVKILLSTPARDACFDSSGYVNVQTVEQGLDSSGHKQDNYLAPEELVADFAVLSEGARGTVTEDFIKKYKLKREKPQVFSLGIKEVIEVPDTQYRKFGTGRVVHALGYPLWSPLKGMEIFGGGILYDYGLNTLAVGIIAGLDWNYRDFSVQKALSLFKKHQKISSYLTEGKITECGVKMIPEGGYYSIPRDEKSGTIGKGNILLLGDGAGFVNMRDIKGLHNAILSGAFAAEAIVASLHNPKSASELYTTKVKSSTIWSELRTARNIRQTISLFGNTIGMPLSMFSKFLPSWKIKEDNIHLTNEKYPLADNGIYDRNIITAMSDVQCREDQLCHCLIKDQSLCDELCASVFRQPCLEFCPGGVYEIIDGHLNAAAPTNCLHCKTCENKCPFNNIEWCLPEGASGPNYKNM